MLKERYFLIEVWQYRPFLLNMFLGMIRVPLIDIVSGPMAR
jgi:centrosomal protein CEP76